MSISEAQDISKHFRASIQFKPQIKDHFCPSNTQTEHGGQKTRWSLIWAEQSSRPRRFHLIRRCLHHRESKRVQMRPRAMRFNHQSEWPQKSSRAMFSLKFSQTLLSITNKIKIMSPTINKRQREGCQAICGRNGKSVQNRCRINSLNQLNTTEVLTESVISKRTPS